MSGSKSWAERLARRRGLHTLRYASYDDYLMGAHWRMFRQVVLDEQIGRLGRNECEVCRATSDLHIHHKTYECLGHETRNDVLILCKGCHQALHGRIAGSDPRTRAQEYAENPQSQLSRETETPTKEQGTME